MTDFEPIETPGQFSANLLIFARLLRRLGLRVSAFQVHGLADGLAAIDISSQEDFYYTLRSFLVHHKGQQEIFDRAYELFWLNRASWQFELAQKAEEISPRQPAKDPPPNQERLPEERWIREPGSPAEDEKPDPGEVPNLESTYSPLEILRRKDFTDYTEEELAQARRLIQELPWLPAERHTRRRVRNQKREVWLDLPRSVRNSLRKGGELIDLAWLSRKTKPRPIVILCDISGSMARYSRLFLHFMYTLVRGRARMEAFVFGTRLTRITRALRHRNIDTALSATADIVIDWSGGTRIGESIREFNFRWSRRVLGHGAVVLIISDGWDRGDIQLLETEIRRLRRRTSHLIWLNPLMGSPDYQPLVRGIQAILPFVDDFLPIHNLASLQRIAEKL